MVDLKIIKDMVKENIFGKTDKHMMVNGKMVWKMVWVFGNQGEEIAILDSG